MGKVPPREEWVAWHLKLDELLNYLKMNHPEFSLYI